MCDAATFSQTDDNNGREETVEEDEVSNSSCSETKTFPDTYL